MNLKVETSDPDKLFDDPTCITLMHIDGVDNMLEDGRKAVLTVCLEKSAEVKSRIQQMGLIITDEVEIGSTAPLEFFNSK